MDVNQSEPSPQYRHLTLLDLVWIVVASAAGFGAWLFRANAFTMAGGGYHPMPSGLHEWFALGSILALAWAWLLTIQVSIFAKSDPFQPGFLAVFAVVVASMVSCIDQFASFQLGNPRFTLFGTFVASEYLSFSSRSGPFVVGILTGWLPSIWWGRWRRPSGTRELIGRGIGCFILLNFVVHWVPSFLSSVERWGGVKKLFS